MQDAIVDRDRFEQLIELAQAYRGWTRKQLAAALGRDPSNLVSDSGIPKLDLVVRLADALDWPVEDVVLGMCTGSSQALSDSQSEQLPETFAELDAEAMRAYRAGQFDRMVRIARAAHAAAENDQQRAVARQRECGGLDGLGQYRGVLSVLHIGLREGEISADQRLALRGNLANAYYQLWALEEAHATASVLVDWGVHARPTDRKGRVTLAFSHYVRGQSHRRFMWTDQSASREHAAAARSDLRRSRQLYRDLASDFDEKYFAAIANTCEGGLIETEVALGSRDADSALAIFSRKLDEVVEPTNAAVGDELESLGWCCIFAANVVLRHLTDPREQQRLMAIFTNKADEIAQRLDNWAIRERIVTMDYVRRRRLGEWTGIDAPWVLDVEDLRLIAGTMGRFPAFRETGWSILNSASIVRDR